MIKKVVLHKLIQEYDVKQVEKHLVYSFIESHRINYHLSPIITSYLRSFELISSLYLEVAAFDIQEVEELEKYMELLIPDRDRKINGAFFTPSYIVYFIINSLKPEKHSRCLDPSCGSGAFLIGLVKYFYRNLDCSIKNILKKNIFGVDILDYNIHRSKLLLSLFALENNEIIEENDFNLISDDSLRANWDEIFLNKIDKGFDIIIGNPPYVKFQDLNDENRRLLSKKWKTIGNGSFNLYFVFFELGYNLLSSKGKLGYIAPNNYFTSLAGESLRTFFHDKKCLHRIVDFSHKKIFDAQTYTAVTFLNKSENNTILYNRIGQKEEPIDFIRNIESYPNYLKDLNVKKWRLLKSSEKENINTIETIGKPLGNMFNIIVGIATLKDELYFLDANKKENGFFLKSTNSGIYKIEEKITRQIYKISDFKTQDDLNTNTRYIIFPYKRISGHTLPYSIGEMKEQFPNCYNYFCAIKDQLNNRDKGKEQFIPFYVYGRSQGITKTGIKILTPTFSKYPRFMIGYDENALFCNGYGIFFKDNEKTMNLFEEQNNPLVHKENVDLLLKILNSYVMHYYISITSVSIQGGYPCYQKNFIEKFTIPDFKKYELDILDSLKDEEEINSFLCEKYQLNIPVPNLF